VVVVVIMMMMIMMMMMMAVVLVVLVMMKCNELTAQSQHDGGTQRVCIQVTIAPPSFVASLRLQSHTQNTYHSKHSPFKTLTIQNTHYLMFIPQTFYPEPLIFQGP
jgi:hypothetical protein